MQAEYNHELGIASLEQEGLKVLTLLQQPGSKRPSINAYLGARYSRSDKSVSEVAQEVVDNHIDGAKRLANIFNGYGHASVGDLAMITLCIENIPMYVAMRFFYLNPVVAGQERSTRFADFCVPNYAVPELPEALQQAYKAIIDKQLADYQELLQLTEPALSNYFDINLEDKKQVAALKARSFDTARYLLPIGLSTSFAATMSARSWSVYLGLLKGSPFEQETKLASLLEALLMGTPELAALGYVPEVDGLLRHTAANPDRDETIRLLLEAVNKYSDTHLLSDEMLIDEGDCFIEEYTKADQNLLKHLTMLVNPALNSSVLEFEPELSQALGEIIFSRHTQYKQLGNLAQSGAIAIEGRADLGVLKDLNRHRSFEKFVPFLEAEIDLEAELTREEGLHFDVCAYLNLPALFHIRKQYQDKLANTYNLIQAWYLQVSADYPQIAKEYVRYLLPHAHKTSYRFYGSIDDLQYTINTRARNGGHIQYRQLVQLWAFKLAEASLFWQPFYKQLEPVIPGSIEQFIDRS